MNLARLRHILTPPIVLMKDSWTHVKIPEMCQALGLPIPDEEGSKAQRLERAIGAAPDDTLPSVARSFLEKCAPSSSLRNTIQDILWEDTPYPPIPKRFRRELATALVPTDLYLDAARFVALLDSLWILGTDDPFDVNFGGGSSSLRAQIDRHVLCNPGDWDVVFLFDKLGAFDASAHRFALFLEGLASADVRPDEADQRRFVTIVNNTLLPCEVELRQTDEAEGYPKFSLVALRHGNPGKPKNLIFATSVRPDIRFRDAVNNDIEIASQADQVLVYDRPIGVEGVTWSALQTWWAESEAILDPNEAKTSLYRKLRESLPASSPAQLNLFTQYFRCFGSAIPNLPALLPEVWLHWDPKTVRERGADALLRFRMDFLLLMPHGVRVVLEVDGKHHYADDSGRASPATYSRTMQSDRDLKLAGYEVFRFGTKELSTDGWEDRLNAFFKALFKHYAVQVQGFPS